MQSNDTGRPRYSVPRRRLFPDKPCEHCGATFSPKARHVRRGGGRFCGKACFDDAQRARNDVASRLATLVNRDGPIPPHVPDYGPCWIWAGGLNQDGYGHLRHGERNRTAHRVAWELATGDTLTSDDVIGHVCDTRACIRTDGAGTYTVDGVVLPRRGHLFRGTGLDNDRDREQKGRTARGSQCAQAILAEDQVREVRRRYAAGGVTQAELGREYGVSNVTISAIVRRRLWRHVN